jgi:hypothetical protein
VAERDAQGWYRLKPRMPLALGEYGFVVIRGFAAGATSASSSTSEWIDWPHMNGACEWSLPTTASGAELILGSDRTLTEPVSESKADGTAH